MVAPAAAQLTVQQQLDLDSHLALVDYAAPDFAQQIQGILHIYQKDRRHFGIPPGSYKAAAAATPVAVAPAAAAPRSLPPRQPILEPAAQLAADTAAFRQGTLQPPLGEVQRHPLEMHGRFWPLTPGGGSPPPCNGE